MRNLYPFKSAFLRAGFQSQQFETSDYIFNQSLLFPVFPDKGEGSVRQSKALISSNMFVFCAIKRPLREHLTSIIGVRVLFHAFEKREYGLRVRRLSGEWLASGKKDRILAACFPGRGQCDFLVDAGWVCRWI